MQRNLALWAIGIAWWTGACVHAQGPMPNPYAPPPGYGYPGYPMPGAYNQPMPPGYGQPTMPYNQPMPPGYGQPMPPGYGQPMPPGHGQPMPPGYGQPMPPGYGQPMPPGYGQPTMPYNQPMPPAYGQPTMPYRQPMYTAYGQPMRPAPMLPTSQGGAAPQSAYATDVPSTKTLPQAKPESLPETLPAAPEGEPVTIYQGPSTGMPLDDEPMALYEGKRYSAEAKLDNTMTWIQASYLHAWIQRPVSAPLVASGGSTLLGGAIGPHEFSGMQAQIGLWLDADHKNAVEITGLWLGKASSQYAFSSNPAGTPDLSIPTTSGAIPLATPGVLAGNVLVNNVVSFYGAEVNFTQNVTRFNGWTFDYFAGARYLYLNDNLSINQTRTALTGNAMTFGGAAVPTGSSVQIYDSFNVNNRFYGGNLGARLNWTCYGIDLGITGKVALGATNYLTFVDGASTLTSAGAISTRTGGTFAQASNIGRLSDTQFTAIPEVDAQLSYQLTSHVRILGGYSFLYWNNAQRAANQLDHSANPAQAPTNPAFNANATASPLFPNARNGMVIQAVNIGLEFTY